MAAYITPHHRTGSDPQGRLERAVRLRLSQERGSTSLFELLVAVPVMLVVLISVFALYQLSVRGGDRTNSRVRSLQQQQIGVERISRELRQATTVNPISSQVVDVETYVTPSGGGAAVLRHVRYDCTTGSCKRYEGPSGGTTFTSGPVNVITDIQNSNVFEMEPDFINPNFVALAVDVGVKDAANPIKLSGGVALKNLARDN
ncbi:MAG: hypothetical protein WD118_02515 [Phycisphaeraceae bacterium]